MSASSRFAIGARTKSDGSRRPGGRPTPARTRKKSGVRSAELQRAEPVVPRGAAAELDPKLPGRDLDLVVYGDHVVRLDVVLARDAGVRGSGLVHEQRGANEDHPLVPSRISATSAGKKRALRNRSPASRGELVDHHAADVVPGVGVTLAGVAEAGDEPGHRPALALAVALGALRRAPRPLAPLLAPPPAGPRPRRASSPGIVRSTSVRSAAGVMIEITGDSGSVRIVTPVGRRDVGDAEHVADLEARRCRRRSPRARRSAGTRPRPRAGGARSRRRALTPGGLADLVDLDRET